MYFLGRACVVHWMSLEGGGGSYKVGDMAQAWNSSAFCLRGVAEVHIIVARVLVSVVDTCL